ncbi:zinc-binding oxidoreductase [Penicillium brevicompactum]|uniref:zinc-binding oxidoreductase n=1 Tax=Penicillium brevicompactum TaxID=5074 RepID=UPI0025417614|nr:zinc-binding oxidoreductase [Penicillium brevicompactum]KAJ5319094.1 zinc-binding oxidoreductase [Penicillium brevicompactum]
MALQKAVIVTSPKHAELVYDRPIPKLREDCILVKNVTVALNPTDWKHIDYLAPPGVLVGCDYAGIVEEVGRGVKRPFAKGDRIGGFAHGSNAVEHEDGTFAEYIVVKGDLQYKIPDEMSFQDAATLGLGVTTAALGLYQSLKIALPNDPIQNAVPILIYGGSTATGTLAIQFAKFSGYQVLTTCSPRHFDQVKKIGADAAFDYNDPSSADAIKDQTKDALTLAFDTISLESSAKYCDRALSSQGGEYSSLLPIKIDRENVRDRATMAYTAFGDSFTFGPNTIAPQPDDRDFSERFRVIFEELLAAGKMKVHPARVGGGGLGGVLEGLQLLKEGKISGEKLVYNTADNY